MTATINRLWDLDINIVGYEGTHLERPQSIADLRKCNNVLVDKRGSYGYYDCMIGNALIQVKQAKYRHPASGSTMFCIEVF